MTNNETKMITDSLTGTQLSTSNLPIFKSELTQGKELRVLGNSEEPWFIAKDIATMLGYENTKQAIIVNVDNEDKITCKQFDISKGLFCRPFQLHP